ncbi:MAG: putative metal-dependent phosphoesterase, family [Clostridiales bacterium]|jgi:predicted metal-dependent phosphoesterase TrpH|nr:putative metal-dependent phosphoesterase, family [Clostridiales bacterium]
MKFDFHIHSVFSDGSSKIEEIFKLAQKASLSALAITDHDTTLGLKTVDVFSKKLKIPFVPAVEFTAVENGIKFHILGYNIDFESHELMEYSEHLLEHLNNISKEQIKIIQANGIEIEERDFFNEGQGGPLYRAKLLKTLTKYGYLKEEEIMSSLKTFFGKGAPCYIEDTFKYYDFEQACKVIKRNGGLPVLAHPGKIKKKDESLYNSLINSDLLDGLEVYHLDNNPEVQKQLMEIVNRKNIIFTGGSDYHGDYNKLKTPICGIWMPEEIYDNLQPYIRNK